MNIRDRNKRNGIPDGLFFVLVGIMLGIILFSYDRKDNYPIFDSITNLVQHTIWNDDDPYVPPSVVERKAPPEPTIREPQSPPRTRSGDSTPTAKTAPSPVLPAVRVVSPPQPSRQAEVPHPVISGYVIRYCVPLELGGKDEQENKFYQAEPEAARRDKWVSKFDMGVHAGKIPLVVAQKVFAQRCDPGEW